jgi:1-acyl-sn-glycerol-3-phosphate acyltransferase
VKKKQKIIYYKDELKDEFSTAQIQAKRIDGDYSYEGGRHYPFWHLFWYKLIAKPIAWLYLKIAFHHKIIGKEKIKEAGGYFLYGNHTNAAADALIPTMISNPVDMYVLVHPNNVSMPLLGKITPFLGALPLPDDMEAGKHFARIIRRRIREKNAITIYPEAHIWPYYTGIRHFKENSFGYPIQEQAPVYAFTNTYQKRKHGNKPRIVTYIDGPFYVETDISKKEQKISLRNQVYDAMKIRSEKNNVELIHYEREKDD